MNGLSLPPPGISESGKGGRQKANRSPPPPEEVLEAPCLTRQDRSGDPLHASPREKFPARSSLSLSPRLIPGDSPSNNAYPHAEALQGKSGCMGSEERVQGMIYISPSLQMGEVSTQGPLTVVAPIPVEFETSLCDATCREGDTLKLKAVLLGEPMPVVSW